MASLPKPVPDQAAPPCEDTQGLRAQIQAIATGLDGAFNQAGNELGETSGIVTIVLGSLQEVAQVFDTGEAAAATDSLVASANRLAHVSKTVGERGELVARIQQVSTALRRNVDDVQRCLRALQIYGMNVKIAASGEPAFVDFADQMGAKLKAADVQAKGFEAKLAELETSLARMQANDARLMRECARVIPKVPDRLIADADALRAHQGGLVKLAGATRELAQSVQSELGAALVAIQVGDRARQRLEHVIAGAGLMDQACAHLADKPDQRAATRSHVLGLLSALAGEIAVEYGRDASALARSLRHLRANAQSVVALQEDGGNEDDSIFLRRIEDGIAEAAEMIAHLQSADEQAAETLEVILATVTDVSTRVHAIRELRIDVRQMAINIGLRCRKVERIGRPVTVIANEIRSHSNHLDTIIVNVNAAETDLVRISDAMHQQAEDHERFGTGDLSHALETIRNCAQTSEMAMATVEQGTESALVFLEQACARLDEALDYAPRIEAAGEALGAARDAGAPPPEGLDHPARALLEAMGRTYTMAGERAVHNAFLLAGMPALGGTSPAPAPGASGEDESFEDFDDFDDGLF